MHKSANTVVTCITVLALLSISCPSRIENVNVADAKPSEQDYSFVIWKIELPQQIQAGETVTVPVELLNNGKKEWSSNGEPYFISYHWRHPGGQYNSEMYWGEKTVLPTYVGSGELISVEMSIRAPEITKFFTLTIDVMRGRARDQETTFWFEERGQKTYDMLIEVVAQ